MNSGRPVVVDNRLLDDQEVVTRVLAGENALFEILMRRYNQRLFRTVRSILRSDAEAEDAVQQAYISAYTKLAQFAGAALFSTWLTRIAVHEALARTRRRNRLAEVDLEELEAMKPIVSPERSPEEQLSGREDAAQLEAVIDALPEGYRVVFMLREVQQLSVAETAECLELSEENVKVRLHRAKAMLRDALYARLESAAPRSYPFLGARCDRMVAAVMVAIIAIRDNPVVN
ncbi:MAG: polymerase, sigma-24 subunit, subfamily [Myxococcales bacterium]|nr:polymerase, sigma-24 subunit, subfamily [Myxococcales bacterium]